MPSFGQEVVRDGVVVGESNTSRLPKALEVT